MKRGASIGAGAVILPGPTIGENAMISAGAVVTRDVADGETIVGQKASPIIKAAVRPLADLRRG